MNKEKLLAAVKKAKEMLFNDPEVKAKWEDAHHITSFKDLCRSPGLLIWLGKRVVLAVELVQKEFNLIEPDEREDVAAKILDDLFEFKGWSKVLELVDDKIFRLVIGVFVNWVNDLFKSNNWINKTFGDL